MKWALVGVSLFGALAIAHADKPLETQLVQRSGLASAQPHATGAGTLYLNRCVGGCVIHKAGINDARTRTSSIPKGNATDYTVSPFAWGDAEWDAIVQCMKEVYSPYKVTVTDEPPAAGVAYNEAIIAGSDEELGVSAGGIAPVTGDCMPYNYVISFSFANDYGPNGRVFQLCRVAAQESGHAYGLDHAFEFLDGSSACRDPMSYRLDCGGQRFFRNEAAVCGEYNARDCACGPTQNSHLKLLGALGAATPITRPPEVTVTSPADGATITAGTHVISTASAQRGIKTVELWLNGYLWGTAKGAAFEADGQPAAAYSIRIPDEVPDGVIDIVVKAKDDIDVTTTATLTVTKGAPCASAESCLDGQRCEEGKCFWDPPSVELGEPCSFAQECLSGVCVETSDGQFCSQNCLPGIGDSCPEGLTCVENTPTAGFCLAGDGSCDGGCCGCAIVDERATGTGPATALTMLFLGGVGYVVFRRRRR